MTEHDNLVAALAAFHQDCSTIEEKSRAQFGTFADLSTVLSAVTPALSKHGLALVQTFDTEGDDDILVTTLYHTSGRHIFSRARIPRIEGGGNRQNPLHLWGGSVTYARRYCALALLGLAAGMEDDDGDVADPKPRQAKPQPKPTKAPPKKAKQPQEVEVFGSVADAHADLGGCTTPAQLAAWVARMKGSSLPETDINELRASYAEHIAGLEEKQEV